MASRYREIAGLGVDVDLYDFLVNEVLAPAGCSAEHFFAGLADAVAELAPRNRELLETRARLQDAIDEWHEQHRRHVDAAAYRQFLVDIGYLVPAGEPFAITTTGVDEEISGLDGPQLVVPITNARYALNAVNARWGSLYDALYGTDALGDAPPPGPYDPGAGARVIAWVRAFLDVVAPLSTRLTRRRGRVHVDRGRLVVELADGTITSVAATDAFAGFTGGSAAPTSVLLRHHGLLVEIQDRP